MSNEIYVLKREKLRQLLASAYSESINSLDEVYRLADDAIDRLDEDEAVTEKDPEMLVGVLTKPFGLKQHEIAQPGHPVYANSQAYVLYLKPDNDKLPLARVTFSKKPFEICGHKYDFNESINFGNGTEA